jgi:hypothetical protein
MSSVDYNKFITPFYEIEISDSSSTRKVSLPQYILGLISKIEINEVFVSPETPDGVTTATLTFLEGSREPASQDPRLGTAGLYQLSSDSSGGSDDISGSITNRSGSILDLRFSGNNGITFVDSEERTSNIVSNKLQTNIQGKNVTRQIKREEAKPKYLFEGWNTVKITWGYKEDPTTIRSLALSVVSIESNFADTGPTTVTVQLADLGAALQQIATKEAVQFATVERFTKNGALIQFNDLKTDEVIRKIAADSGWAAIVSKNLLSESLDRDKFKIWIAGESFHEFISRLAIQSNCVAKTIIDAKTLKPTIYFIKKDVYEEKPPLGKDKYFYLNYKQPGSLIKNITITSPFNSPKGDTVGNIDKEGDKVQQQEFEVIRQAKGREGTANDKNHPALKQLINNIAKGEVTGIKELTPNENPKFIADSAKASSDLSTRDTVTIDITTIGYPKFVPGVYPVSGVGARFSGFYRIHTTQHIIDSSGYISKLVGNTHSIGSELVANPEAGNIDEVEISQKVQVRQATPRVKSDDPVTRETLDIGYRQ